MRAITVTLQVAGLLATLSAARDLEKDCSSLKNTLRLENTTILDATRITPGVNISTPGSCQSSALSTVNACRVYAVTNTTQDSAVHFEVWLPDTWYGRFLALGNGGLGGCIDYGDLDYGNSLHFATVSSDNGHDGNSGIVFLNHPEVINDFAFRAIHVEAVLGKQIVEAYYNRTHDKSYYLGCSTGGRQGIQSALLFLEDFDGILAGAPATDFNHFMGWSGMLGRDIGAPNQNSSDSFIPAALWPVISQEILKQCDKLDGVEDGIITEPDECIFRSEAILCDATTPGGSSCLTSAQVEALTKIYRPIYGTQGEFLYPRYDPGAEGDDNFEVYFTGELPFTSDWTKFVVYNDSNHSLDNHGLADIELTEKINAGGIATWNGNLSAFQQRGGKLITYHGRRDQYIASGNSKRMYNLISSTLSLRNLDEFYRLFLIPGMNHCLTGPGAWAMGQGGGLVSNAVNDTANNILLALVDWVEAGKAPDVMVGSTVGGNMTTQREHCRYPQKSTWNGTAFRCED